MRVRLDHSWFAPSAIRVGNDKIYKMSGRRFKAGVHLMPEELRPHLPKSAVIEDEAETAEVEIVAAEEQNLLRVYDTARAAAEAEGDAREKAEKFQRELEEEHAAERKRKNQARMAQVRAAKLAKTG